MKSVEGEGEYNPKDESCPGLYSVLPYSIPYIHTYPIGGCIMEGNETTLVPGVDLGSVLQQVLYHIQVVVAGWGGGQQHSRRGELDNTYSMSKRKQQI